MCLQLPRSAVGHVLARMGVRSAALLRIADCSSKSPISARPLPPKAPGNRPTLPHVAPEGAKTPFASTTAYFCTVFSCVQGLQQTYAHRLPAEEQHGAEREVSQLADS